MLCLSTRHTLLLALILALLLVAVPVLADDEEEEGGEEQGEVETDGDGDQGEPSEGDTTVQHPERFQGADDGQPRPGIGDEWVRAFHPIYQLDHARDQDVASWTHGFTMNYPLSPKIGFRATSSINTRENDALNRLNRQETWTAGMDVNVSTAVTTGINFRRTKHVDVQNEGAPNESRSLREKESVKLSTGYHKVQMNGLDVTLGASAGLEKNKYADVKSKGATQGITAGLRYSPISNLQTDFNYTGNHSLLDSEQGDLSSTDESIDHNLSGRVDYKWREHGLVIDLGRSTGTKEYPKQEQTEIRDQRRESTGVTADLELLEGMSTRLGFNYNRSRSDYRVEPTKNNDIATRKVDAHMTYALGQTSFKADLGSEKKRNEFFGVQTGDNYSNTLSMSVSHKFRDGFDAELRGRMSLLSVHFDDVEANDQDRDLYNRSASFSVNYRPRSDITTGLLVRVKEDQLIYIRRSRTGNNKTSQTFAIEPFIRKSFSPKFSASQKYQLSADYTFYTYDVDANFLIRNMSVTTGINWKPIGKLNMDISHTYRIQDEGAYVRDEDGLEKYGKDSERVDQKIGIGVNYRIADIVDIEVRQELGVQEKWKIDENGKTPTWDKFDTSIVGRASTDYTLPDGTSVRFSVARTHRDATSISDRQREVWNISLKFNRTF